MSIPKTKTPATLLLALAVATGISAKAAGDASEVARHNDNKARIAKMHTYMQPKVGAIITDLEGNGWRPLIDAGVWRTPAQQAAKVSAGVSSVPWSFHNASTPAGKPDSLAADIVDKRWFWEPAAPRAYSLQLASSAESHNLTTGIYWGLNQANRQKIHTAIARDDWDAKVVLGWDTYHVEPTGITLGQARKGLRPPIRN